MKRIILLFTLLIPFLVSCRNESSSNVAKDPCIPAKPYLKLDKKRYNFGTISKAKCSDISIDFEVSNDGELPLVIIKTDVSCGCLSVDTFKKPILPGEKVRLTVHIDTKNQIGTFNKLVFVKSNAENDLELLRIMGEIVN